MKAVPQRQRVENDTGADPHLASSITALVSLSVDEPSSVVGQKPKGCLHTMSVWDAPLLRAAPPAGSIPVLLTPRGPANPARAREAQ